jgi:predicted small lipoprotein YifL
MRWGRQAAAVALIVLVAAMLSACGKKPGSLKPPDGEPSTYPRTYPQR